MNYLYDSLREYCGSDHYPFHMPGHKRRLGTLADPFSFDITEIDGFDNLHHAEGILLEAQRRAAGYYGSSETHFLVNGSTCGILSAISACVPNGKILMARNCHKAAYHGVMLGGLEAVYLYPQKRAGDRGINGPILAEDVEAALKQHPDIKAVFLTSPTYDGVISDIKAIAELAHTQGIPLIVDEAHGAHFGMHPIFPESAVHLGGDVVIQSLHKTLPSLTQTALLHVNGDLVNRRRLRKMLGVYQSSSPSYVLMSGMDQCIRLLESQGKELFDHLASNLQYFYEETAELTTLKLIKTDDPSKILIAGGQSGLSGLEIGSILRSHYHLEMEMEAVNYVLALTSVGDTKEGFVRLAEALRQMDEQLRGKQAPGAVGENGQTLSAAQPMRAETSCMTIAQAQLAPQRRIHLTESAGYVLGEFLYLYPPGIPLVVPGERMEGALLAQLLEYKEKGYSLQGLEDYSMEYVWVVDENGDREKT